MSKSTAHPGVVKFLLLLFAPVVPSILLALSASNQQSLQHESKRLIRHHHIQQRSQGDRQMTK
jgi:hypothetical protein